MASSAPDARSDARKHILESLVDSELTLGDLYRLNQMYPWADFVKAMNDLTSEGLLAGSGDGFVVLYSLTNKGQRATGPA